MLAKIPLIKNFFDFWSNSRRWVKLCDLSFSLYGDNWDLNSFELDLSLWGWPLSSSVQGYLNALRIDTGSTIDLCRLSITGSKINVFQILILICNLNNPTLYSTLSNCSLGWNKRVGCYIGLFGYYIKIDSYLINFFEKKNPKINRHVL